jgi:hypothetical protein
VGAVRPDLDEAGIRRYLLGLLPEAEAEALEEEYFARPEALERIRGVEDDLLDDYAAGRLGPDEKRSFESRYLASQPLRDRVLAARALHTAAVKEAAPTSRLSVGRLTRWAWPLALAAGLLLAVVASWLWHAPPPEVADSSAPPTSAAPSEKTAPDAAGTPSPAAVPSPSPPRGAAMGARVVVALSPVLLRGQGRPAVLGIPPGADTVLLELEGDPALLPRAAHRLDVLITTVEGRRAWSGSARRLAERDRPTFVASAAVPADRLVPADYLVTLSAAGETIYSYFFRVTRD